MFRCEKYKIDFHSSKNTNDLFTDGKPNNERIKKEIEILKERMRYLSIKLTDLYLSDKNTLFVIKVFHDDFTNDIVFVKELYFKIQKKYKNKKFVLLVIFEARYLSNELKELETDNLKIRSVEQFADDNNTDTTGDLRGWNKVLAEILD